MRQQAGTDGRSTKLARAVPRHPGATCSLQHCRTAGPGRRGDGEGGENGYRSGDRDRGGNGKRNGDVDNGRDRNENGDRKRDGNVDGGIGTGTVTGMGMRVGSGIGMGMETETGQG